MQVVAGGSGSLGTTGAEVPHLRVGGGTVFVVEQSESTRKRMQSPAFRMKTASFAEKKSKRAQLDSGDDVDDGSSTREDNSDGAPGGGRKRFNGIAQGAEESSTNNLAHTNYDIRTVKKIKKLYCDLYRQGKVEIRKIVESMEENRFFVGSQSFNELSNLSGKSELQLQDLLRVFYPHSTPAQLKAMCDEVMPPELNRAVLLALRSLYRNEDYKKQGVLKFGDLFACMRACPEWSQYIRDVSITQRLADRMVTFRRFAEILFEKSHPSQKQFFDEAIGDFPNYVLSPTVGTLISKIQLT